MRVLTAEEKEGIRRFLGRVTPEQVERRIREAMGKFPEVDAQLARQAQDPRGGIQPAEDRTPERVVYLWTKHDLFAKVRRVKEFRLEMKAMEMEGDVDVADLGAVTVWDEADVMEEAAENYAFDVVSPTFYIDLRLNARVPPAQAAALAEKTYREVTAQRLQHLRELVGGGVSVALQPAAGQP
jgi:hypothetical protein